MLVPRPTYLQKLEKLANKQIIKVLTGVRRCGKSSLLQLFQQQLLADGVQPEQIQAINFEDLAFWLPGTLSLPKSTLAAWSDELYLFGWNPKCS